MQNSFLAELASTGKLKRGQQTKARIIEQAETAFAVNGYDNTSIAELARLSGLSGASVVSHHFPSKYSLLKACAGYRGYPINLYRRALLDELRGRGVSPGVVLVTALLRPYTWCFNLVGRVGPAGIGVCVGRFVAENPDKRWPHAGGEHSMQVSAELHAFVKEAGVIGEETFLRRAQVFSISTMSCFVLCESKLAKEKLDGRAREKRWGDVSRELVLAACSVFQLPLDDADSAIEIAREVESQIGEPDWSYLATVSGVIG